MAKCNPQQDMGIPKGKPVSPAMLLMAMRKKSKGAKS